MLSVVMPAYNEEGCLKEAVQDVVASVLSAVPQSELVIVNDGSKDATGRIADALASQDPRIRVLHQPNQGHGVALLNGIKAAKYDTLFLLDSDRQMDLSGFPGTWEMLSQYEAVIGVRSVRHDPWIRLVVTRLLRGLIFLLFAVQIKDANIPYKLLPRKRVEQAMAWLPSTFLIPSVLMVVFIKKQSGRMVEVPVQHFPRRTGQSTYRQLKLLKVCVKAAIELVKFRLQLLRMPRIETFANAR